jgi:hypothetical protein
MTNYIAPEWELGAFTCSHCGVLAQQFWSSRLGHWSYNGANMEPIPLGRCQCSSCKTISFWSAETKSQILPRAVAAPMPHVDLPESAKKDYLEARTIAGDSPRAAAALLRLCVQKLLAAIGGKGKNIDSDIAALVGKGLPPQVRDALDICRVVGNNAVHPGEINVDDDPALVAELFELINFIVAQTIERERSIAAMVAKLPQGARDAIARRDAKNTAAALPSPQLGS